MNDTNHDEIDLFEFVKTLWDGKWKIIAVTTFVTLLGGAFFLVKPHSYEVSDSMQRGHDSVFIDYIPINDFLIAHASALADEHFKDFLIDPSSILLRVIDEFNDYEEMLDVLSRDNFVKQSIEDLKDDGKQKALIDFAKLFTINLSSKNKNNANLFFEWHDVDNGKQLLNDALSLVLVNVKGSLLEDINKLAIFTRKKNQLELDALLTMLEQRQKRVDEKYILYLSEQSAIAKELNIENIDSDIKSRINPMYLRGYRAIDKEISIVKSRSEEQRILMAEASLAVKNKIYFLKENLVPTQLRSTFKQIEGDDPNDWVNYDLKFASIKSMKNALLSITVSIFLGGMLGMIYVLIADTGRRRSESLTKT